MGLGNPGAEYARTRHNVGAEAIELLAQRCGVALRRERNTSARAAPVEIGEVGVLLAVPETYMNESGLAARLLIRRLDLGDLGHLVVVHDELDLPVGAVRVKRGGGTAGHNGLRSLQAHLHSLEFLRVRIGIGRPPGRMPGADYVLRRPGRAEREELDVAIARAADAVELVVTEGADAAMNLMNVR